MTKEISLPPLKDEETKDAKGEVEKKVPCKWLEERARNLERAFFVLQAEVNV